MHYIYNVSWQTCSQRVPTDRVYRGHVPMGRVYWGHVPTAPVYRGYVHVPYPYASFPDGPCPYAGRVLTSRVSTGRFPMVMSLRTVSQRRAVFDVLGS